MQELKPLLKEAITYMGLTPTRIEFVEKDKGFSRVPMYAICLDFEFSVDGLINAKQLSDALVPQIDGILESQPVKNLMDKLEKRILELETKCIELEKLVPFKNHFELEMMLRHGETKK